MAGELCLWYMSHRCFARLLVTKYWCFGLCYKVSYNIDGTDIHAQKKERKKKIAPYPRGKSYLGTSSDVCSFFLGKRRKLSKQIAKHGLGCVPHVYVPCFFSRRTCDSRNSMWGSNCTMWITDQILKKRSSIMKRIFRKVFGLLKFNYQMKIFFPSRGVRCSKFIIFRKTSTSTEVIWN